MNFVGLGKKVRPGTFGKIEARQREYPKGPSVKKHEISSDPMSADPIRPFPSALHRHGPPRRGAARAGRAYTRSPLEDSRLFGPGPWKILATTYEKKGS